MATINSLGTSDPIEVAAGGTGAATFTDGAVLLGSGAGALTALDVTAKGSLMVGDGTTDPVALAVGANDTVLTADSGEASGAKWAAAAGGAPTIYTGGVSKTSVTNIGMPINPGCIEVLSNSSMSGVQAGNILYFPVYIPSTTTYNDISVYISTGSTAGDTMELILYNVTSGLPGTKVVESGAMATDSVGYVSAAIDTSITVGAYFLGLLVDDSNGSAFSITVLNTTDGAIFRQHIFATSGTSSRCSGFEETGNYTVGNAPTNPTGLVLQENTKVPYVWLEID